MKLVSILILSLVTCYAHASDAVDGKIEFNKDGYSVIVRDPRWVSASKEQFWIDTQSSYNGICKALGFESWLGIAIQTQKRWDTDRVRVGKYGELEEYLPNQIGAVDVIKSISCKLIQVQLPTSLGSEYYEKKVSDPSSGNTVFVHPNLGMYQEVYWGITSDSDTNALCGLLGYNGGAVDVQYAEASEAGYQANFGFSVNQHGKISGLKPYCIQSCTVPCGSCPPPKCKWVTARQLISAITCAK